MWFKNGLKAQKLLAQGSTLGTLAISTEMISYQAFLIGGVQYLNHGTIPIRMITHIKPYRIKTTKIPHGTHAMRYHYYWG